MWSFGCLPGHYRFMPHPLDGQPVAAPKFDPWAEVDDRTMGVVEAILGTDSAGLLAATLKRD